MKNLLLVAVVMMLTWTASVLAQPTGNPQSAVSIKAGENAVTVYEEMTFRGLRIHVEPESNDGLYLREVTLEAPAYLRRGLSLDSLHLPPELQGQAGLITVKRIFADYELTFTTDKPARLYAYIDWYATDDPNPDREKWHIYYRDPWQDMVLYYRDFPPGRNTVSLHADPFIGVGMTPLDSLSDRERIVVAGRIVNDQPLLQIRSDHSERRKARCRYRVVDPDGDKVVLTRSFDIDLEPEEEVRQVLATPGLQPGILAQIHAAVTVGEVTRKLVLPYGHFPVPASDPSVREPLIPYGGYMKLAKAGVTSDWEVYSQYLRASFYHLRRMKMNACVLDPSDNNLRTLDLAQRYALKCVIRLGGKRGIRKRYPDEIVNHPAVLTYMIGDEPKRDEIELYSDMYDKLTEAYPNYDPITCTILGGWGTGGKADASLILNHHLSDYDMVRFGRLYCFRKSHFGLLRPIDYKNHLSPTGIFNCLGASHDRPWWLGAQFFGHDNEMPYWRIPDAAELRGLFHLAFAHGCRGILGWCLHSHKDGRIQSVVFEGKTMAPARHAQQDALAEFGRKLMQAKSLLLQTLPEQVSVNQVTPSVVEAQAHWLEDGRILVYVVNRDTDRSHDAELWIARRDSNKDYELHGAVSAVSEVWRSEPAAFELVDGWRDVPYYKLSVSNMRPGGGRLLVVEGQGKDGAFEGRP